MIKIFNIINKILNILFIVALILAIAFIIAIANHFIFSFLGVPAIAFISNIIIGFSVGYSDWFNRLLRSIWES